MNRKQLVNLISKIRATAPRCPKNIRCDICDKFIQIPGETERFVCEFYSEHMADELIKHGIVTTKCTHKDGDITEMFGEPVGACTYVDKEKYCNVTVTIAVCKHCGDVDISWEEQDNTEAIPLQEGTNEV